MPLPSIPDTFLETARGSVHYGVVPVENSTEGAVGRSLDLMPNTPMRVCGEVIVRIHHNLMAKAAHGLAPDLATAVLLATDKPVLLAGAVKPRQALPLGVGDRHHRRRARAPR